MRKGVSHAPLKKKKESFYTHLDFSNKNFSKFRCFKLGWVKTCRIVGWKKLFYKIGTYFEKKK